MAKALVLQDFMAAAAIREALYLELFPWDKEWESRKRAALWHNYGVGYEPVSSKHKPLSYLSNWRKDA